MNLLVCAYAPATEPSVWGLEFDWLAVDTDDRVAIFTDRPPRAARAEPGTPSVSAALANRLHPLRVIVRLFTVLVFALLAAGCGGAKPPPLPAPPIEPADKPARDFPLLVRLDQSVDEGWQWIRSQDCEIDPYTSACPDPTPEELEAYIASWRAYRDAMRPAKGSEPRVVARLPLGAPSREAREAVLIAWQNAAGALCFVLQTRGLLGGARDGGDTPRGPCLAYLHQGCRHRICLAEVPSRAPGEMDIHWWLGGLVPVQTDELWVPRRGGRWSRYASPHLVLARFPAYQVVLLDLVTPLEGGVRLVADGHTLAANVEPLYPSS